jgi:SAM-dependent methyltransferase
VSWDPQWERIFASREWGRYPPEELVRFVARSFYGATDRGAVHILELGCGPGANVWYLAREGFAAHGIDGSATAIEHARSRLEREGLRAEFTVGDFTELLAHYEPATFDAVVDIAAVQCNRADAVRTCIEQAKALLKPGGKIFSMMVATGSWGDGAGREIEPNTFVDISEGPLVGTGLCRFFTIEEIESVFASFEGLEVDYAERSLDARRHAYRHWLVTGVRSG